MFLVFIQEFLFVVFHLYWLIELDLNRNFNSWLKTRDSWFLVSFKSDLKSLCVRRSKVINFLWLRISSIGNFEISLSGVCDLSWFAFILRLKKGNWALSFIEMNIITRDIILLLLTQERLNSISSFQIDGIWLLNCWLDSFSNLSPFISYAYLPFIADFLFRICQISIFIDQIPLG